MTKFRRLSEETVFEGRIFEVARGIFEDPEGRRFARDIMHHPGAVATVPIDGDDIILVRQYRPALDALMLEIPAGLRDVAGEPTEETARRELIEEVGLAAESLELLTTIHNAAGYCDELITIYLATGLTPVTREPTDSPEELAMEVVRVPLVEAGQMIADGEITDAKTVVGVLATLRR